MGTIDKTRLLQYVYLKMEYQNQLDRLAKLENDTQIPGMVESDGSQRSILKGSRMENATIRKIEFEEKLSTYTKKILDELSAIEDAIDRLKDPMQKEVLRLRYIDCINCRHTKWPDVALKIYGSDEEKHIMAIWRIHGHALQELAKQGETTP